MSSPLSLAPRFLAPAGLRWGMFRAADGAQLRWCCLASAQPDAPQCVLTGGFTEFIEKYFETIRDLAARGFTVWCLDWRSQGGSDREQAIDAGPGARRYDRDAEDLALFIRKTLPPDAPRLLVAHSMGGAIALLALHANPALVRTAVLSAPMLDLETGLLPRPLARGLAWLAVRLGFGSAFVPGGGPWRFDPDLSPATSPISHDAERCLVHRDWFADQARLRVHGPTFAWADAAFALVRHLRSPIFLQGITTPLLIGSAGRERFVRPSAHRRAARHLPNCTLVDFPFAKHELFHETDDVRARWFDAIDAFCAQHIKP